MNRSASDITNELNCTYNYNNSHLSGAFDAGKKLIISLYDESLTNLHLEIITIQYKGVLEHIRDMPSEFRKKLLAYSFYTINFKLNWDEYDYMYVLSRDMGFAVSFCEKVDLSEAVQLFMVRKNTKIFSYIKNPSELVKAFINGNSSDLY